MAAGLSLPIATVGLQGVALPHEVLDAVPAIGAKGVSLTTDDLDVEALVRLIKRSPGLTSITARAQPARSPEDADRLTSNWTETHLDTETGEWHIPITA